MQNDLFLFDYAMMRRARILEGRERRRQRLNDKADRLYRRSAELFRQGRRAEAVMTAKLAAKIRRGI